MKVVVCEVRREGKLVLCEEVRMKRSERQIIDKNMWERQKIGVGLGF